MQIFSCFCGCSEEITEYPRPKVKSAASTLYPGAISVYSEDDFALRVRQFQKEHPEQSQKYKKKQQKIHAKRDLDNMKENVKKSLRMMDHKNYLRYVCFSLWPKYMNDRMFIIEQLQSDKWMESLIRQFNQLESVFSSYIQTLYKNAIQNTNYLNYVHTLFNEALDRISGSEKWVTIHNRIQHLYKFNRYYVESPLKISNLPSTTEEEFKYPIDLLTRVYIEPQFSKKIQHLVQLRPVLYAYSNPRLIRSVCQYCICKTGLVGYKQMLELLQAVYALDEEVKELSKLLKTSAQQYKQGYIQENPFESQYLLFNFEGKSSFIWAGLGKIVSVENNWVSLTSLTNLRPEMSITLQLDVDHNNFKVGIIGNHNTLKLKDLSSVKESVCLCLHSSTIIVRGQRQKIKKVPQIGQITISITSKTIEWRYLDEKVVHEFNIQWPLRLHIVMKKGTFKQLPFKRC